MSILFAGVVSEVESSWVGHVRRQQSPIFFQDETICTREVSPPSPPARPSFDSHQPYLHNRAETRFPPVPPTPTIIKGYAKGKYGAVH